MTTRTVSTDLNILIVPSEWDRVIETLPTALHDAGFEASEIHSQIVDLTCEPDNMLVTQFSQMEGHPPIVEVLHRVVVNGTSDLELKALTKAVVSTLPQGIYWYGTSNEGETEPGVNASCAWQHGN
ncbi:hypothetical protein CDES_09215 [Corynebacterium deserti GIMN1.010]|uniref:Uncharacterized protein n=1 Tax=Corynebacterium deserti GIMN1.010 TaxID=931089 RepID=A0A0M4CMG9_9CORY|nr:hypothetical protein [Corynebacterium deserti]ALC06235.1 hypothetical protein CDES_09215 [Corynebacterium deserti GIMN1.010]